MSKVASAARARRKRRLYYPPRLGLFLKAVASLSLGTVILLELLADRAAQSASLTYFLLGAFVFFGGTGAILVYRIKHLRPTLALKHEGLTVRLGAGRSEHIAWEAITDVHICPAPSMHMLRIVRRTPAAHWTDKAAFWRHPVRPAPLPELAVPSAGIAAPLKKVEAQIRRRVPL